MQIDINCDMGEDMPNDALLMPLISSANIACGYHAGNKMIMQQTVELAVEHGIAIGAHPGFNDRANFGRTEMQLNEQQIIDLVTEQILLLKKVTHSAGTKIKHVKPHGALYNMAAKDASIAAAIAKAVYSIDPLFVLFGLSGSCLISEAEKIGLTTANEVFADRTYQDDGSLTPRSQPNALIATAEQSLKQVLQMVVDHSVTSVNGKTIPINAQTICVHGDGEHAVSFAKQLHRTLTDHHIRIKPVEH